MIEDQESFEAFAQAIADANKLDRDIAADYASRIGDTPELDENGRAIVRDDNGAEIARITLPEDAS
jgi:hypothetical protein